MTLLAFLAGAVFVLLCQLSCIGLAAVTYIACYVRAERRRNKEAADRIMARIRQEKVEPESKPDQTVRVSEAVRVLFPGNNTMN